MLALLEVSAQQGNLMQSALPQQPLDSLSGCTGHFVLDVHMAKDLVLDQ